MTDEYMTMEELVAAFRREEAEEMISGGDEEP
jgi:hypothetical protein